MVWFMDGARLTGAWGGLLAAILLRAGTAGRSGADRERGEAAERERAMALRQDRECAARTLGRRLARDAGLAEPPLPAKAGADGCGGK